MKTKAPDVLTPRKSGTASSPRTPLQRLERYYTLARQYDWDLDILGWDGVPPVPRADQERWLHFWASIVQQQLQADRLALEAATQLLLQVEEREAKLYYSTMVQDEAKHLEGWTRLVNLLDSPQEDDPYLAEMGQLLMEADTLEEKVIAFQVVFEGGAIEAFRDIASTTQETLLGAMSEQLVRDDSIHHNSGMAYAEHLLDHASPALKRHVDNRLQEYKALYLEHLRWRPPARQWMQRVMQERDAQTIEQRKELITKALVDLGLRPPFDD